MTGCGPDGRRRGQQGSGTLLLVFVAMLVLAAGLVAVLWCAVSVGRHRAAAAADLAALSAAQVVQGGPGGEAPCQVAGRIAVMHDAELVGCTVDGETVQVVTGVRVELGSLGSPRVAARARAGPVSAAS